MTYDYWPMFDIALTTRDLELRHLTEADLPALARTLPPDVELDPAATMYDGLDKARRRGVVTHQEYWKSRGSWCAQSWALNFGVFHDGELIGSQGLEGEDFPMLRTVDSSSFLAPAARGLGLGKQMRSAVLALAFGPLGAAHAITSAWHDNGASLGVSRALGYVDNGLTMHRRGEVADVMAHMRLSRDGWLASGSSGGVVVPGVEKCMPSFGLG